MSRASKDFPPLRPELAQQKPSKPTLQSSHHSPFAKPEPKRDPKAKRVKR